MPKRRYNLRNRSAAQNTGAPRQAVCKRGHPMAENNVYRPPGAPHKRECLSCKKLRSET
jgi:hypothetical protein